MEGKPATKENQHALETIFLLDTVLKIMETADPLDSALTFKLAYEHQTTYYDASYIALAKKENLMLVTEDTKLRKMANKLIKAISASQLTTS